MEKETSFLGFVFSVVQQKGKSRYELHTCLKTRKTSRPVPGNQKPKCRGLKNLDLLEDPRKIGKQTLKQVLIRPKIKTITKKAKAGEGLIRPHAATNALGHPLKRQKSEHIAPPNLGFTFQKPGRNKMK